MTRPNRFHPHNRQNQASHPLTTVSPPSVSLRNQAGKGGNENLGGEGVRCPSFLGAWAALIVTAGPASDVTVIALVLAVASPRAVTVAAVGAVLSSSAYLCNRADKGDQTGKGGNINLGGGEWNVKLGGGDGE